VQGVAQRIGAQAGRGAPLSPGLRGAFEPALGADLSGVRIHDDAESDALARSVGAKAFTSGADVFFRAGRFDPGDAAGRRLIAHEVVHTVQQANGPVEGTAIGAGLNVSDPHDRHEQEADAHAQRLAEHVGPAAPVPSALSLQRDPDI